MDWYAQRKMRVNLAKGIALLAVGFAAVMLVELAWDAGFLGNRAVAEEGDAAGVEAAEAAPYGRNAIASYVLEDDEGAIGVSGDLPADFVAECFSPSMLGEARCTEGGSVMGITSELAPDDLFALCSDSLCAHGWLRVESGQDLRSSYVKDVGRYRWLYLDVTPVAGSSTAVVVVRGAS